MTELSPKQKDYYIKKTRWMYTGVFSIAGIIVVFFVLAAHATWRNYSWQQSQEQEIIQGVRTDINDYLEKERLILAEQEKQEAKTEARETLNDLLNKNYSETISATGTASGTD